MLPLPDAAVISPSPICENDNAVRLTPTTSGGLFVNTSYLDQLGMFDPSTAGIGNHKAVYIISSLNGCESKDSIDVVVNSIPDASFVSKDKVCLKDGPIAIMSNTIGGSFTVYSYINESGVFIPSLAQVGMNQINYQVTSSEGCSNSSTDYIEVGSLPDNTISLNADKGCEGFELELTTEVVPHCNWVINNETIADVNEINTLLEPGTYPISLEAISDMGGSSFKDTVVTIFNNPIADFIIAEEEVYITNPEVTIEDNSKGQIISWNWNLGDAAQSTTQDIQYRYKDTGLYHVTLEVADINGCKDNTSNYVQVIAEFSAFIPTAFTPNDDGKNDIFRPVGFSIENMEFALYNKWGQQLMNDSNFKSWDGTVNGEMLDNGTYIYQMKFVDKKVRFHFKNGSVYLLR